MPIEFRKLERELRIDAWLPGCTRKPRSDAAHATGKHSPDLASRTVSNNAEVGLGEPEVIQLVAGRISSSSFVLSVNEQHHAIFRMSISAGTTYRSTGLI